MRATARWGIGLVAVAAGWLVASSAARWGMVSHHCAQHPAAAKGRVATDHPGREVPGGARPATAFCWDAA
jgi:hypothetical protein